MKVLRIKLEWFRGAADNTTLVPAGKSVLIYGENGAGKSSFVDAIEYLLCDGKIGHLAHEYSGKHQEKGLVNTHAPKTAKAVISIECEDGTSSSASLDHSGKSTWSATNGVCPVSS